jgi:hypothetical protein
LRLASSEGGLCMLPNQPFSSERLAELETRLSRLNQAWEEWDGELAQVQKGLEKEGMDRLEAAGVVHRRQVDAFRAGTAPLDLREVQEALDELCALYLKADQDQRTLIRDSFEDKRRVRVYLHSYIGGRAASRLRSTAEARWLDLGLAAASICDQKVDYRDLLIALGKLWLEAEEVGVAPARHFSAVGRISSGDPVYGNRCTRDLLRGFRISAYLKSIRGKGQGS